MCKTRVLLNEEQYYPLNGNASKYDIRLILIYEMYAIVAFGYYIPVLFICFNKEEFKVILMFLILGSLFLLVLLWYVLHSWIQLCNGLRLFSHVIHSGWYIIMLRISLIFTLFSSLWLLYIIRLDIDNSVNIALFVLAINNLSLNLILVICEYCLGSE